MKRLTEKDFWDSIHEGAPSKAGTPSLKAKIKALLKPYLGETFLDYIKSYRNYILWNVLYNQYMPKTGLKLVEVGSAPGDHLVRLRQTFGVDPYGIEYSDIGVVRNRQLFSSLNIDPNHVIHADFFAEEFHKQYTEAFDIVVSIGFIEHFADAESVIEKHLNLLRTGGTFMISVPNFRGFNYFLLWFFQKELIPLHNFEVMHKEEFIKCFTKQGVRLLFCDYYGTFDFELFSARTPWKKLVWNFCIQVQHILNLLFRLVFRNKGRESMFFSPMLIAIGVKDKSADHEGRRREDFHRITTV